MSVSDPPRANTPQPADAAINWDARQNTPVRRLLNLLERISLAVETPVARIVRQPQFNPLYHTGTITVFLLLIILFTGVYLTMFYQFGVDVSYKAVAALDASLVGRFMRSLHRYASALVLFTTLLHGWRTLFMDRFRGPRWLAWVTGMLMAALVWVAGVSGYWLIFDERTQVLNQTLINLSAGSLPGLGLIEQFLLQYLLTAAAGSGWIFVVAVITVHFGVSLIIGLAFWYHIKRLSRAKILPPRYWMWALIGALVVAAVAVPAELLPPLNAERLPGALPIDLFYLSYLPAALNRSPWLFWTVILGVLLFFTAIPWLLRRKPLDPVAVDAERCTGCTLCAADCPYTAITMVERSDESGHKYLAEIDESLCVSCGICIGSCPPLALSLGDIPPEPLWRQTLAAASQGGEQPVKLVFTCERHAYQGARSLLHAQAAPLIIDGQRVEIAPITCVGMAHPDLASQALEAGAAAVQFVGCPPEDCANREGNLWLQERRDGERKPKLRRAFADAPISTAWLPPNDFKKALSDPAPAAPASAYRFDLSAANWRQFIPALVLLLVVMAASVLLTRTPFQPYPQDQAVVEIVMAHQSGRALVGFSDTPADPALPARPTRLLVSIDGEQALDRSYPPQKLGGVAHSLVFEQISLAPGRHSLRLAMFDRPDQTQAQILFDGPVDLDPRQIFVLEFDDASAGPDPARGEKLYFETSLGTNVACRICHSLEPGVVIVGPSFAGVATRAAARVPGLSAEEYLYQSIVDPDAYVVEGFPAGQMLPNFGEILSQDQIDDLIAFLMTMQ